MHTPPSPAGGHQHTATAVLTGSEDLGNIPQTFKAAVPLEKEREVRVFLLCLRISLTSHCVLTIPETGLWEDETTGRPEFSLQNPNKKSWPQ